jgi:hypothetical protein
LIFNVEPLFFIFRKVTLAGDFLFDLFEVVDADTYENVHDDEVSEKDKNEK